MSVINENPREEHLAIRTIREKNSLQNEHLTNGTARKNTHHTLKSAECSCGQQSQYVMASAVLLIYESIMHKKSTQQSLSCRVSRIESLEAICQVVSFKGHNKQNGCYPLNSFVLLQLFYLVDAHHNRKNRHQDTSAFLLICGYCSRLH